MHQKEYYHIIERVIMPEDAPGNRLKIQLSSRLVGVYSNPPDKEQGVKKGDLLGILTQLGIQYEIYSNYDGIVERVLQHGTPVEYNQELLLLGVGKDNLEHCLQLSPLSPESGSHGKRLLDPNLYYFRSPLTGILYLTPSPGGQPYVQVGSEVNEKTVLCVVEVMKTFCELHLGFHNDFKAKNGIVTEILKDKGYVKEGEALFSIKPIPCS